MSIKHELRIVGLTVAIMAGLILSTEDPLTLASAILFGPSAG